MVKFTIMSSGRGHGVRPGKHSAACWCGEGEAQPKAEPQQPNLRKERAKELILQDPERSGNSILAEMGLNENHHRVVETARKELEEEGKIPRITDRRGSDGTVRRVPGSPPRACRPSVASAARTSGRYPGPAMAASSKSVRIRNSSRRGH